MDTRWIEQRSRGWYAVMDVPRPLRAAVGKKRFVKSLRTRDVHVARAKRHAAIAAFTAQIDAARRRAGPNVAVEAGLAWRDTLARIGSGDAATIAGFLATSPANDDAIRRNPVAEAQSEAASWLADAAEELHDAGDEAGARTLLDVARGRATPLLHFIDRWLAEGGARGPYRPRVQAQLRSDLARLETWAKAEGVPTTIEAFDRRTVGRFVSALVSDGAHRKTANRRISATSAYWRWLVKRAGYETNPWTGQSLAKITRPSDGPAKPKRPLTDAELVLLLTGDPGLELADAIRLAALSGMRIEELYRLRVADCAGGWFDVKDAKTVAGIRRVPIHPDLSGLVGRRTKGRAPADFLLHEPGPMPPKGERSAAASKRFGRYRKARGVHEQVEGRRHSAVDFHSLRRWFVTAARNAGQDRAMVAAVVGHEAGNLTDDVYSGGPSDAVRRAVVEAVRLPAVPAAEGREETPAARPAPAPRRRKGRVAG